MSAVPLTATGGGPSNTNEYNQMLNFMKFTQLVKLNVLFNTVTFATSNLDFKFTYTHM